MQAPPVPANPLPPAPARVRQAYRRVAAHVAGRPGARPAERKPGIELRLVYLLWFIILFDPQWLLAGKLGLTPLLKVPLGVMGLLAITLLSKRTKGDWIWGLLAFIVATAVNLPYAYNRGLSMVVFKLLIVYYVFGLCVVRFIKTPKQAAPILSMLCVWQFVWWGVFGIKSGSVGWHPNLANFDGYGPLMCIGVGMAYFYSMATKNPKMRTLALVAAGLCVAGVVSSFARGAVASLVATIGFIWLRSPNKGRNAAVMVVAAVILVVAGSAINGRTRGSDTRADFFTEMMSSFDAGDGTANDRKVMWAIATREFLEHPVLGVGADQFGVYAAENYPAGTVGGQYDENPGTLYGRALHSNYYQILSEYGLVGAIIFIGLLVQFFRGTRLLKRPEAQAVWVAKGGTIDVGKIAYGLEGGMTAFLLTGYFYNQLFSNWFYSLIFTAILLRSIISGSASASKRELRPVAPARRGLVPTRA